MAGHSGLTRRRFIAALGGTGAVFAMGSTSGCMSEAAGKVLRSELSLPNPFTVPLPVPRVLPPSRSVADEDRYSVTQRAAEVEIIPGMKTTVWGYDGTFPGPTIVGRAGRRSVVNVANELPVPTSTHLHGGVTPAGSDGYPTDLVVPAGYRPHHHGGHEGMVRPQDWVYHHQQRDYTYPLEQSAATLWYHDHRMDFSAPQVWRGLAGFFLVGGKEEDVLPLPSGEKDVPLMMCDRAFEADGSFRYPALDPTLQRVPGVKSAYMQGVQGDVMLVNGAPWPIMEVSATKHRFRILNASNARRYRLALDPPPPEGASFVQVGSDNGLLAEPVNHEAITTTPAERFDVVIDFAKYPVGTKVTLINELEQDRMRNVMRFHVVRGGKEDSAIPSRLTELTRLRREDAVADRSFDFRVDTTGGSHTWTINGKAFNTAEIAASPALGSVELWRFTSDFHHPVHLHLAHFQVVSRNGRDPGPMDSGWKDTVDVRPYETVEVLARFNGYRGKYMMHCHNLEHEDMAMMANFQVV